ncbi:MAG: hypothetical protein PWP24_1613 [Clostridiales bacterium]|nr:hypothetical protein [Clostridiales bacterium]
MQTYTIRELSDLFSLPPSTLRYYEEVGVLTNVGRTCSKQRIYTEEHINRLNTIHCLKGTGMSMAKLQKFFTYEEDVSANIDDILLLLDDQKEQVESQLLQLQSDFVQIQKKRTYYQAIKAALEKNNPLPKWEDVIPQ